MRNSRKRTDDFLLSRPLCISLLVFYSSVVLLHFFQTPLWMLVFFLLGILWRFNILRERWHAPNAIGKFFLVIIAYVALYFEYGQWFSVEPMLSLLLISLTFKLLEIHAKKDFLLLIFLSYFVIACSFLFQQSVLHTLHALVSVILVTASLLQLHSAHTPLNNIFTLTVKMLFQSAFLAAVMMLVLPRINPLWSVPVQSGQAIVGVSDSMSPGDFNNLIRSNKLAMRITFEDQVVQRQDMYWRGLVFDNFDGRRWQRSSSVKESLAEGSEPFNGAGVNRARNQSATGVRYEVLMEPTSNNWLYGIPVLSIEESSSDPVYTDQGEVLQEQAVHQRIKYLASSTIGANTIAQQTLYSYDVARYTDLPDGMNPQSVAQAKQWYAESSNDRDYIDRVLRYYRERFTYTLSPPKLGRHTVDEFLFSSYQGFCEHFSSSFTVLMRAVNIPARVVVGYQGGQWNADEEYLQVFQRDAHAWAEVWLQGQGWVRVDPTAAVASVRIQQGVAAALPQVERQWVGSTTSVFAWVNKLQGQWQQLDYQWQRWVLDYDAQQQQNILERYLGNITPLKLALTLLIPFVIVASLMALHLFKDYFKQYFKAGRKEKILYYRLQRKLEKQGVSIQPGESIAAYCDRAVKILPQYEQALLHIKKEFEILLYSTTGSDAHSDKPVIAIKHAINSIRV